MFFENVKMQKVFCDGWGSVRE